MTSYDSLISLALTVSYRGRSPVLSNLFLQLRAGEILGLAGASGSGKSTLAAALLRLIPQTSGATEGSIVFQGGDLLKLDARKLREIRGQEIALVPQNAMTALNPALCIGQQLLAAWNAHAASSYAEAHQRIMEALTASGLPDRELLRRHTTILSPDQLVRILIAMALLHNPCLLIVDDLSSTVDGVNQAEIFALLSKLNRERNLSILYLSRDLLSLSACDRIAILHDGQVVECGATTQILHHPVHPYTRRWVYSLPERPRLFPESSSRTSGSDTLSIH
ncbi:MAG TPA: ATP-binding cassette domain-containing protein [Terriglobales bacterium]|nr:ATP-binding cassette domain-containing protein [Terriglobales bacterium]